MDFNSTTGCLNDNTFGPTVVGCRDDFDFTLVFEQSILSIAPSACFTALAAARIAWLSRKPRLISARGFQVLKICMILVYASLQLALLIMAVKNPRSLSPTSAAAASLSLLDALLFLGLSALEHSRSSRSSILFNVYLLITLLFDIAQSRTLWLDSSDGSAIAQVFTAALGAKVGILLLEAQGKGRWLNESHISPESTSGVFSLSLVYWMNDLVIGGYRKILAMKDLYVLDEKLSAGARRAQFQSSWKRFVGHKYRLALSLFSTLRWPILSAIVPRIAQGALNFGQPFLINSLLAYLQKPPEQRSPNTGYGFIGAAALVYLGLTIATVMYRYLYQRSLSMMRASLVATIYEATIALPCYGKDNSAALTLMNSDVNFIRGGLNDLHECWANTIEAAIACWLLHEQLGTAFVAPVIVVLVCGAGSIGMGSITSKRMHALMKATEKRVGLIADVISNMTAIKMSGLAGPIETLVQRSREDELDAGRRRRMITTLVSGIAFTPLLISPVITFAVTSQELTVTRVFTSLAYIQLLCTPLTALFQTIPLLMAAFTCLGRVQRFLERTESDSRMSALDGTKTPGENDQAKVRMQLPQTEIVFRDASFAWEVDQPVLRGLDLRILESQLTMVVGPVASGKSTLCKALLGELPFAGGEVQLPLDTSKVSFCDQTPFLFNGTLRQNIVGFNPPDKPWYDQVLQATALVEDVILFPQGDESLIGTNAITLSGGQRQRVSIARALFSRPSVAIFDDVLSGLDAKTNEHVFRHVFGPSGLLRRIGATVVLCTHSTRFLPWADHIVALENLTVAKQGSFTELNERDGYVQRLGAQERKEGYHDIERDSEHSSSHDMPAAAVRIPKLAEAENGDRRRQLGDFAIYKYYFSFFKPSIVCVYLLAVVAVGFTWNFNNVWLEFWSSAVQRGQNRFAFYLGVYLFLQLLCIMLLVGGFGLGGVVLVPSAGSRIHRLVLRALVRAPLAYFSSVDAGVTTNHFSQDISVIDNDLSEGLSSTVMTGAVVVGGAAVIGASSPYILVGYPFMLGLIYLIQRIYLRTSRQLRYLELEGKAPLYTHFLETLNGLVTIRAFGWTEQNIALSHTLFDESQRSWYLFAMVQLWLSMVLNMTVAVLAVIFVTLATQLAMRDPGFTGVGLVSFMSFGMMLGNLVRLYTHLENATGAVSRLKNFSERIPNEDVGRNEAGSVPENWPSRGNIEISNVSAKYERFNSRILDTSDATEHNSDNEPSPLILRDISLSIAPGEKVAICGRTGSGKSSLVLLLLRFLNPASDTRGSITIDDIPLESVPPSLLRERIIALPQHAFILNEGFSVRDSLDTRIHIGGVSSFDDHCIYALQSVGLWDAIQDRGGLDAELKADSLSKGQKQLFCLARAVLRQQVRDRAVEHAIRAQGGILLLDEFNACVDGETDRLMQDVIRREFAGWTILSVVHRLDAVLDYNRVLVLEKGEIVEIGNPRDLSVAEGSRFREMWLMGNDGDEQRELEDDESSAAGILSA